MRGGKSELHRAGWSVTRTPGDRRKVPQKADYPAPTFNWSEFKLLVEERRIVESIAGNENLEIQWRLATLKEAKSVVTQYHKYLSENSLIKSIFDDPVALPPPERNRKSTPAQ